MTKHTDIPNGNGRIYPMEALERCVEKANAGPVLGVLGWARSTTVDMAKVSHTVQNLRIEGDYLVGEVMMLATPSRELLEKTFSACDFRASGTGVIRNGIVTDYNMVSIDAVYDGADL